MPITTFEDIIKLSRRHIQSFSHYKENMNLSLILLFFFKLNRAADWIRLWSENPEPSMKSLHILTLVRIVNKVGFITP